MPSFTADAYYVTEAVVIAETEILRDITNRYGEIEGPARFIKESELFHIDLPQAVDGHLTIAEGMPHWWAQPAYRGSEMN